MASPGPWSCVMDGWIRGSPQPVHEGSPSKKTVLQALGLRYEARQSVSQRLRATPVRPSYDGEVINSRTVSPVGLLPNSRRPERPGPTPHLQEEPP
ncbi:hypothetical protein Krad_2336 [Kineococcus radiotolerans SRS30216 = ATCC BAA-149]|uniref:Uncharacterized protein n=1 Tax=Kineococcus radiotolerans (strain ATCC BAA-149 / DSM 14245 / SRS30216) TaxID=266940 RepID=A6WAH7_KINRD|nr:hypothetical protein Krad_2336 [Kineococcus radiotolerans SRS30216 = ATCC BAA-149]